MKMPQRQTDNFNFIKAMLKELASDELVCLNINSMSSMGVWFSGEFRPKTANNNLKDRISFNCIYRHKNNKDDHNFRVMWASAYSRRLARKWDIQEKLDNLIIDAMRRTRALSLQVANNS